MFTELKKQIQLKSVECLWIYSYLMLGMLGLSKDRREQTKSATTLTK